MAEYHQRQNLIEYHSDDDGKEYLQKNMQRRGLGVSLYVDFTEKDIPGVGRMPALKAERAGSKGLLPTRVAPRIEKIRPLVIVAETAMTKGSFFIKHEI